MMLKYLTIFKISLKEYFVYRLNFILWRFRMFLSILIPIFLWLSVYATNEIQKKYIISYFLIFHLLYSFVYATRTHEIAKNIRSGEIINLLVKPISFFKYHFIRDLADKALNTFFALIEIFLIYIFIGKNYFFINQNINLFILFYFILAGIFINFFVSLIFSFIGFVSPEYWAPRFLFMVITNLFSGLFIPLNFLPDKIYNTLIYTPFPYFSYISTQLLIGRLNIEILNKSLYISIFWVILLGFFAFFIWRKSLKSFSFWGK